MKNVKLVSTISICIMENHYKTYNKYKYVNDECKICHEGRHTKQFVELEDDCVVHSLPRVLRPLLCQSSHRVSGTDICQISS